MFFFDECFTFWKRDCSRLHAISLSTRQNTVRVAQKQTEFREAPRHIDFIFWILQPLQGFGAVRHDTRTRVWSQISIKVRDSRGRIFDSYTL